MTSGKFPFTEDLCAFKIAIKKLTPYKGKFNCLIVNRPSSYDIAQDMLDTLKAIGDAVSSYGRWKSTAFATANDKDAALSELKNAMKMMEASLSDTSIHEAVDARKVLDLDLLNGEIMDWVTSLWFLFDQVPSTDACLVIYKNLFIDQVEHLARILREAEKAFDLIPSIAFQIHILSETVPLECAPEEHIAFGLSDHVVSFSEEELEAIARRKSEEEEEAKRQQAIEDAKKLVDENRKEIVDSYNAIKDSLIKFKFKDDYLSILENPRSIDDSNKISSLYRFLMAMSNSVRYMPGEDGPVKDRIKGSFIELDQDVLRYNSHFTLYLNEYNLTHNDIVNALKFFSEENGKIVAQYVDTKEYVEEYKTITGPKILHLFVM